MKLSATTRSTGPPAEMSFVAAPSTPVPSVMRTRATIASANLAPTNDSPAASERTGAAILARLCPFTSNNSIVVAAAARRLLARGAPVRWIAQQGAVFHNLRGDVPRRGYDSRNRWRRHRGDAVVVIARAEREEGDDECEGAAKSALHGMILLVQSECECATWSKPATRDLLGT